MVHILIECRVANVFGCSRLHSDVSVKNFIWCSSGLLLNSGH